jgi:hypothetical protein
MTLKPHTRRPARDIAEKGMSRTLLAENYSPLRQTFAWGEMVVDVILISNKLASTIADCCGDVAGSKMEKPA